MDNKAQAFSQEVEIFANENKVSHLDALEHFCQEKGVEFESVAPLVSNSLKEKIALEAQKLHFLPKTSQLPI